MKKLAKLSVAVLCLSAVAGLTHAAKPGAYVGAGLGEGMLQKPKYATNKHDNVLAGRLFAGYNFNECFGLEAGLAKYGQASNKFNANYLLTPTNLVNYNATAKTNLTTFDVVGKAYLPIQNSGFNLYGLAGLSYVHNYTSVEVNTKDANGNLGHAKASMKQNSVHPIYGVGASYDIPDTNFVTNLELSRTQGSTKVFGGKKSPNVNMLTFNVAYNFN